MAYKHKRNTLRWNWVNPNTDEAYHFKFSRTTGTTFIRKKYQRKWLEVSISELIGMACGQRFMNSILATHRATPPTPGASTGRQSGPTSACDTHNQSEPPATDDTDAIGDCVPGTPDMFGGA